MSPERLVTIDTKHPRLRTLGVYHRIEIEHPILVRKTVSQKLTAVAAHLPDNLQLQVDSGYRSRQTQEKIYQARKTQLGDKKANKLVYNPEKGIPPHSTGGAIDVTLTDSKGKEINLSEPFAKYYEEPTLHSNKISPEAQHLRLLLHTLMLQQEFAPHTAEYWHFSYGDQMWADYYDKTILYDEIPSEDAQRYSQAVIFLIKTCKLIYKAAVKSGLRKINY